MFRRDRHGIWPGLDLQGATLTEIRRRVRKDEGVNETFIPSGRSPERIGDILRRMRDKGELPTRG